MIWEQKFGQVWRGPCFLSFGSPGAGESRTVFEIPQVGTACPLTPEILKHPSEFWLNAHWEMFEGASRH